MMESREKLAADAAEARSGPGGGLAMRVLFIDGEAIVIDKPAGLAVHPGPATRFSLEERLGELTFGFARLPTPVHRLDRDTSGCLLLARHPRAHRRLARTFEEGSVEKVYAAVLAGVPGESAGQVDLALAKISSSEAGWRVVPDPHGKPAFTDWRVAAVRGGRALVLFRPATGRTHQVRVHAASGIGIPVLGDPVYDKDTHEGSGRMLLHALSLGVPREGKPPVTARAPLPEAFAAAGFEEADLADAD